MASYAMFDTAFGRGGLAWGEGGILAVSFPARGDAAERSILRRAKGATVAAPPTDMLKLMEDVAALFRGEPRDLRGAKLDYSSVEDFERRVYEETRAIPAGAVKSYGEIARALGDVALSQRVGQALARNPFPIVVPCHRVVGADGRMTGFSAPGGTDAKLRLLKIEGGAPRELFD